MAEVVNWFIDHWHWLFFLVGILVGLGVRFAIGVAVEL